MKLRWETVLSVSLLAVIFLVGCAPQSTTSTGENSTGAGSQTSPSGANSAPMAATETAATETAERAEESAATPEPPASTPEPPASAESPAPSVESAQAPVSAPEQSQVVLGGPELTSGIPGSSQPLKMEEIQAWLDDAKNHLALTVSLPLGLAEGQSQIKGLEANPLTRAKIELGRQLYFEKRLSSDGTVSCASCHDPAQGFAAHTQFGVGVNGQTGDRNSPVSFNRILSDKQFWDGRAESLEAQAVGPIANPIEMANTHEQAVETLKNIPGYKLQFDKIFGDVTIENVGKAIASFERVIVTNPSPYDFQKQLDAFAGVDPEELKADDPEAYQAYEKAKAAAEMSPMSDSAKRGSKLFFSEKANCSACHVGANLADELYHNLGVGMDAEKPDAGRAKISGEDKDTGAFKTPTVRNAALTGPYMHDGSQKTLEEVVEWYAKGGHPNPHLSQRVKKLDLTDEDKKDLVAFMQACTSEFTPVVTDRLPE